ncbi:MAG: esterase/lipase family protein [Gemmataceae bacterium]
MTTLESPTIVLIHGLGGFDRLFGRRRPSPEYFPGIRRNLELAGYSVIAPRLSPTGSIAHRAAELVNILKHEVGPRPMHLIGHSMGGLDARYAVARLGLDRWVRRVTTIGTPHRGSTFADWALVRFARNLRPLFRAAGLPMDALFDLTTESALRFNDEIPNVPGIVYDSVAGVCEKPFLGPEWAFPARIVGLAEGANDGVVSVQSARWGERFRVWNGDHLNIVNWPNRAARKRGLWRDRSADYEELLAS